MITWFKRELVVAIHDRQLSEHGGQSGIRDQSPLDSALARPEQRHASGDPPPDLAELATSLASGLARNHPFLDGNKRTAHVCHRLFLALNGMTLTASPQDKYVHMLALAEGSLGETEFANWLRAHVRVEGKLNEPKAEYQAG